MHPASSGQQPDPPQPQFEIPPSGASAKRLGDQWLPSWRRLAVISILFTLFVFCSSVALDYLLLVHRDSPLATVEVSDGLAALVAGVLFYRLLDAGRRQRKLILQRLETIEQMNHHIRNALQVISFTVHSNQEHAKEVGNIDHAVKRIQWALSEILPKM